VIVDLDGIADDGEANERDNVAPDVEDVIGGLGSDTLIGSSAANRLLGYGGDDRLIGLDGTDELSGGTGADTLLGGLGNDALDGVDNVSGNDALNGEEGGTDGCQSDPGDSEVDCEA
jgi:Ca2+-binding RTX toxin-like protein